MESIKYNTTFNINFLYFSNFNYWFGMHRYVYNFIILNYFANVPKNIGCFLIYR